VKLRSRVSVLAILLGVSTHAFALSDEEFRAKYHIPVDTNNLHGFNHVFDGDISELGGFAAGELNCYMRQDGSGSKYCVQEWRGQGKILTQTTEMPDATESHDHISNRTLCIFYYNQTTKRCWDNKGMITDYGYGAYGWRLTQTVQFVWP
jgi:hypothetical protein